MSAEMACTCGELPPHSHIFKPAKQESAYGPVFVGKDTGEIRIWVDWKEVARELCRTPVSS